MECWGDGVQECWQKQHSTTPALQNSVSLSCGDFFETGLEIAFATQTDNLVRDLALAKQEQSGNGPNAMQHRAIAAVVDLKRKKVILIEQGLEGWQQYGIRDPVMAAVALEATRKIASPTLATSTKRVAPPRVAPAPPSTAPIVLEVVARLFARGPVDWSALDKVQQVRWSAPRPRKEGELFQRSGLVTLKGFDSSAVSFDGDSRQAHSASVNLEDIALEERELPAILAEQFSKTAEIVPLPSTCPKGDTRPLFKVSWPDADPVLIHVGIERAMTATQQSWVSIDVAPKEQKSWICR